MNISEEEFEEAVSLIPEYSGDVYCFEYDLFSIRYDADTKEWTAISNDPDLDDDILLESETEIFEETSIFGYILSVEEFMSIKKRLQDYLEGK